MTPAGSSPAPMLASHLERPPVNVECFHRAPVSPLSLALLLQFMKHELTQQRLHTLGLWLDTATLATTPMGTSIKDLRRPPAAARTSDEVAERECRMLLTFLQAATAVLPLVALAWLHWQPGLELERGRQQQPQQRRQQQQRRRQQPVQPHAVGRLRAAWRRSDGLMSTLCLCRCTWLGRVAGVCWMLPLLWIWAKAMTP
jgi:hypothetical protein